MDIDYKPNSHRYKEAQKEAALSERKEVKKVVTGNVKTKKKGEIRKLKDIFIADDVANVKSYIVFDVLIPAVKKAISDIVTNGIDMILYGEKGRSKKSSISRISYNSIYSNDKRDSTRSSRSIQSGYDFDDIILETRGEAEDVLDRMDELIETYGMVSVADLYDLVGISGEYTDNKYGWTSLRNAEPVRMNGGYLLKLPRAMPLPTN